MKKVLIATAIFFVSLIWSSSQVFAQDIEQRVSALESYVDTFQPTLVEYSQNLQGSIQDYTNDLETSLQSYTRMLQEEMKDRIQNSNNKRVVLDLGSQAYRTIKTNTGSFLISVEKVEELAEGGYRIYFNIGNTNYADYRGFKLKLMWGRRYFKSQTQTYDQWRETLTGSEYTFDGTLTKGYWSKVEVDVGVENIGLLSHLECEMDVLSVELRSQ